MPLGGHNPSKEVTLIYVWRYLERSSLSPTVLLCIVVVFKVLDSVRPGQGFGGLIAPFESYQLTNIAI